MPDTGWKKEAPKVDGVYWWRADAADNDPDIHCVQGEFFYQTGFASSEVVANFGGEWLGPITPSDFEQLVRLREVAEKALDVLDLAEAALKAAVPYCAGDLEIALNERARKAKATADEMRAALETKP